MTLDLNCDYCVSMLCSEAGVEEPHEAHAQAQQQARLYVGDTFLCDICGDEDFVEEGITHAGFDMCAGCYSTWDDHILLSDEADRNVCKGHYCDCFNCAAQRAALAGIARYTEGG